MGFKISIKIDPNAGKKIASEIEKQLKRKGVNAKMDQRVANDIQNALNKLKR